MSLIAEHECSQFQAFSTMRANISTTLFVGNLPLQHWCSGSQLREPSQRQNYSLKFVFVLCTL